jgi:hypothetical protein
MPGSVAVTPSLMLPSAMEQPDTSPNYENKENSDLDNPMHIETSLFPLLMLTRLGYYIYHKLKVCNLPVQVR